MTANHAHTPTTRDIRMAYVDSISRNNPNDYGDDRAKEISAEFFRWLTAHEEEIRQEEREDIAAAEQRGAARGKIEGLREAAEELDGSVSVSDLRDDSIRDGIPWTLGACLAAHDAASPITDWLRNRADQMEGDDGDV